MKIRIKTISDITATVYFNPVRSGSCLRIYGFNKDTREVYRQQILLKTIHTFIVKCVLTELYYS